PVPVLSAPPPPAPTPPWDAGTAVAGTITDALRHQAPFARRDEKATSSAGEGEPLRFTSYHPSAVAPQEWATLLVYSHVAAALEQIQADAATFTELGSSPTAAQGTASRVVVEGVELIIEPHMEGVIFSPTTDSFIWRGGWHRSLFRFSGTAALAGTTQGGWI